MGIPLINAELLALFLETFAYGELLCGVFTFYSLRNMTLLVSYLCPA